MANFPTAVTVYVTRNPGDQIPSADWNSFGAEISAIEDGLINGSAPINSSNATFNTVTANGHLIASSGLQVTGNSTFGSTITIGGFGYIFPSSAASTSQLLAVTSTSASGATLSWRYPQWLLLASGNGSDSNAVAANVATVTVNGLTADDTILVTYQLEAVAVGVSVFVSNTTDGVNLVSVTGGGSLSSGALVLGRAQARQRQGTSTAVCAIADGQILGGARSDAATLASVATAWTGTWTLALRHGGVGAGGQLKWAWVVYKMAGQVT